jgi:hypothetical protein
MTILKKIFYYKLDLFMKSKAVKLYQCKNAFRNLKLGPIFSSLSHVDILRFNSYFLKKLEKLIYR